MWAPLYFRQGGVLIYRLDGFLCLTTNLQWRVPLLLKWKWSSEWVYIKMRSDSSSSALPFSLALIFPLPLFPSFSFLSLSCSLAHLPWFLYRPICTAESLSSLFFFLFLSLKKALAQIHTWPHCHLYDVSLFWVSFHSSVFTHTSSEAANNADISVCSSHKEA